MIIRAIEEARAARMPLSEGEKAMLFDLAMAAGGSRLARSRTETIAAAPSLPGQRAIIAFRQVLAGEMAVALELEAASAALLRLSVDDDWRGIASCV